MDTFLADVVKYLRTLGVEWNEDTFDNASERGHLELLKWAKEHQYPFNEGTCASVAENGHLELLIWAREHQYLCNEGTCVWAPLNVEVGKNTSLSLE